MITLECNYSKKLGLPGYSSHQFAITLRTEIADLTKFKPKAPGCTNCSRKASIPASRKRVAEDGGRPVVIGTTAGKALFDALIRFV